ncbi:MAG: hypothetical protein ACWGO1_15235, partial [Anaerolineales bacterium]
LGEYGVLLGKATGETGGSGGFDVTRLLAWAQSMATDNVVMLITSFRRPMPELSRQCMRIIVYIIINSDLFPDNYNLVKFHV